VQLLFILSFYKKIKIKEKKDKIKEKKNNNSLSHFFITSRRPHSLLHFANHSLTYKKDKKTKKTKKITTATLIATLIPLSAHTQSTFTFPHFSIIH